MADVSMCPSQACPSRSRCYRNAASGTEPDWRQSYMNFDARRGDADRCDSFWPCVDGPADDPRGVQPGKVGEGGGDGGR